MDEQENSSFLHRAVRVRPAVENGHRRPAMDGMEHYEDLGPKKIGRKEGPPGIFTLRCSQNVFFIRTL